MNRRDTIACAMLVIGATAGAAFGQASNAKGKISRNFYRIPYDDGQSVRMNQDYVDHGNTPAGDFGSMDMVSQSAGTHWLVAAAAGMVTGVSDGLGGCGCHSAYGPCGNFVQITHANGEVSFYLHLQQNSATNLGIVNNLNVVAGQRIGIEGDIGWTCGGGRAATASPPCVNSVPLGATACGPHLHWNVVRATTGERVNPMTCGISNNLYLDNGTNTSGDCPITDCVTNSTVVSLTLNAFGEWRVFQADNQITASTVEVNNMGSIVLHAGNSVRMLPGFHIDAGGYGRAEIGACDTTAFAPSSNTAGIEWPPPIDLSHETEGY